MASGLRLAGRLPRTARALRPPAAPRALAPRHCTALASPAHDKGDAAWEAEFVKATEHVSCRESHADSAGSMRKLLLTGLLRHTDLRDNPNRFFKAHRLLARHAVAHGPGFWIRFTVLHHPEPHAKDSSQP